MNKNLRAHLFAIFTIIVWGTTYISTKVLLQDFKPVEILMIRFIMGFVSLCIIYPHKIKYPDRKLRLNFLLAGFSGICLYYLLENVALTFTMASNVGVIISVAPFFTALIEALINKNRKILSRNFILGFILAITGICFLSFGGQTFNVNPKGDLLAFLAAIAWAIYSNATKKISDYNLPTVAVTRNIFFYGMIFMLPCILISGVDIQVQELIKPVNLFNLMFLGFCASAICFVTWNYSVKLLGAVRTSVYIYLSPVVTVISSMLILHERLTVFSAAGILLTMVGLIISNLKAKEPNAE